MRILLLSGGDSNEREISLLSGNSVAAAIKELGYEVMIADPKEGKNLVELTKNIDIAFIALHGAGGEDGEIQAKLESLNVPFVSSGSDASKLCFDKLAYKTYLKSLGLPVSEGKEVTLDDMESDIFKNPYVLKPINGGSSLDTQIVKNPDKTTLQTTNNLLRMYDSMLWEPLVEGQEITVGILGSKALPVAEIVLPADKVFDFENKYSGATEENCPPIYVRTELQTQAQKLAEEVHKATGCQFMSRTDMIIDKENNFHILETNTIPGLTNESFYPKIAKASGLDMPELIDRLINMALRK